MGLSTAMLSGDLRAAAQAVAARLGIDVVEAEILPEGKAGRIAAWQEAGESVAMSEYTNAASVPTLTSVFMSAAPCRIAAQART
jgi:high-affinity K+ transport system ATPase subunit B